LLLWLFVLLSTRLPPCESGRTEDKMFHDQVNLLMNFDEEVDKISLKRHVSHIEDIVLEVVASCNTVRSIFGELSSAFNEDCSLMTTKN